MAPSRRSTTTYAARSTSTSARGGPVTREDAAAAVGISRKLAAFHLDKLVGRACCGPGSGRRPSAGGPGAPLYEPAAEDIAVRVPERAPGVLASILVEAVSPSGDRRARRQAVLRVARSAAPRSERPSGPACAGHGGRRAGAGQVALTVPGTGSSRSARPGPCDCATAPSTRSPAGARTGLRAEPRLPGRDGRGTGRRRRGGRRAGAAAGRVLRRAARVRRGGRLTLDGRGAPLLGARPGLWVAS